MWSVSLSLPTLSCSSSLENCGTSLSCQLRVYSFREDFLGFLQIISSHHRGAGVQRINPFKGWPGGGAGGGGTGSPGRFSRYPNTEIRTCTCPRCTLSRGGFISCLRVWPLGGAPGHLESPGKPSTFAISGFT